MNTTDLNELNQEILMRLQERGLAVPSYTRLNGKFALRVSITNHRSTRRDFDFLVEKVVEIAEEFVAEKTGVNRTEEPVSTEIGLVEVWKSVSRNIMRVIFGILSRTA
jgi:glutamate/tyrosine decarboxylase-like PLP-dependent enzyme